MGKTIEEMTADEMITEMAQGLAMFVRRTLADGANVEMALNIIEEILSGLQMEWIKDGLNEKTAIALKEHLGSRIADEGLKDDLMRNGVVGHA